MDALVSSMCTSYESSPACSLLATVCVFCNRPLVDAESVERGCGPTCAENNGFDAASLLPSWGDAGASLVAAFYGAEDSARAAVPGFFAAAVAGDARRGSNALTARIAARAGAAPVTELAHLVAAVQALGFVVLARRLTERLVEEGAVKVEVDGAHLVVRAPFSRDFNEALRVQAPARRWDRDAKAWRLPVAAKRGLWNALRDAFPGHVVISDKGTAVIPSALITSAVAA